VAEGVCFKEEHREYEMRREYEKQERVSSSRERSERLDSALSRCFLLVSQSRTGLCEQTVFKIASCRGSLASRMLLRALRPGEASLASADVLSAPCV
jgi:hypothetical protein